jgi:hypothetical protein
VYSPIKLKVYSLLKELKVYSLATKLKHTTKKLDLLWGKQQEEELLETPQGALRLHHLQDHLRTWTSTLKHTCGHAF